MHISKTALFGWLRIAGTLCNNGIGQFHIESLYKEVSHGALQKMHMTDKSTKKLQLEALEFKFFALYVKALLNKKMCVLSKKKLVNV